MSLVGDGVAPPPSGLPPARLLAAAIAETEGAFLSHGSALAWHRLAPAPPGLVTATAARYGRSRPVGGAVLRFVRGGATPPFGVARQIVPGGPGLLVSDPERSVVDALRRPDLCGGLAVVVGALWRGRDRLSPDRLAEYALNLPVASAGRRLGFLLEALGFAGPAAVSRLRPARAGTWILLDPIRGASGPRLRRWGLRLNADLRELAAAAGVEGAPGLLPAAGPGAGSVPPQPPALFPPPPAAAAAPAAPLPPVRPRRLAGLCRRYDLLRLVVLEGAWAEIAGTTPRNDQGRLRPFVPARIAAEGAAYDAPGSPGAPDVLPILAEMDVDRILGPAELLAVERELAQLLGRPVVLRTMRELLHRVARLALHAGTVVYHRHDRGQ